MGDPQRDNPLSLFEFAGWAENGSAVYVFSTDKKGHWAIMKVDTAAGTALYAYGLSASDTAFANFLSQTYKRYEEVF